MIFVVDATIPQSRLQRYSDFVSLHSTNGVYDPESGMEGLLSVITPDPKGVVLYSMANREIFFDKPSLHQSALHFLESHGLDEKTFPLTVSASWNYIHRVDKENNLVDGSLIDVGAVVKEVYQDTSEGLKVGYYISESGLELALPIVTGAVEFVNRARNSGIPHKYDSMWRVLGSVNSSGESRRQLTVYRVIRHLIDRPSACRAIDIIDLVGGYQNRGIVGALLKSLREAGVVDYRSVGDEVQGIAEKGWSLYSYTGEPIDVERVIQSGFYHKSKRTLPKVIQFIQANPDLKYEATDLSKKLGISANEITGAFSAFVRLGIMSRESEFATRERRSVLKANDLTKMLFEIVLEPAWYSASTLQPVPNRGLRPEKLKEFLANYQEERSHLGPAVGDDVRDSIIRALSSGQPTKLSHIEEQVNKDLNRGLTVKNIVYHLGVLMAQGLVENTSPGFYLKPQS